MLRGVSKRRTYVTRVRVSSNGWRLTAQFNDKRSVQLVCFACGTKCEAMVWRSRRGVTVFMAYYCPVCRVDYGRVSTGEGWHIINNGFGGL